MDVSDRAREQAEAAVDAVLAEAERDDEVRKAEARYAEAMRDLTEARERARQERP
jgi:hypothetical protein